MQKIKVGKWLKWMFVALWMLVIFVLSDMDSEASSSLSESTTQVAIENTLVFTNGVGITDKHPSEERVSQVVFVLQYTVRKFAHMFLYLVLTLLVLWALGIKRGGMRFVWALAICFLYACSDEFHQLFVPGRTGAFVDCLIDLLGGVVGCLVFCVIEKRELRT